MIIVSIEKTTPFLYVLTKKIQNRQNKNNIRGNLYLYETNQSKIV